MARGYSLKDWEFDPAGHALKRGTETVRLEHRAAALLALLCENRGEIVSQPQILNRIWNGRHVSTNSVPVVIADLRRALGDDARQPRFIETVNKGGYRLMADSAAAIAPPRWTMRWALAGGGVVAAMAVVASAIPLQWETPTTILIEDVRNATGMRNYDTLAAAAGGHVLSSVKAHPGLQPTRGAAAFRLQTKLVLWSGKPELLMSAQDSVTGRIVWTGEIFVPEAQIPGAISKQVDQLDAKMSAQKSAQKS
ncbi:MAG: winged helix-turn-helix domain-containing protein [Sphingomonas sp.]